MNFPAMRRLFGLTMVLFLMPILDSCQTEKTVHLAGSEGSMYVLELPSKYSLGKPTFNETTWRNSLLQKHPVRMATFMLTDLVLEIDGQIVPGRVYENRGRAGQFLIINPHIFIVDCGKRDVGTAGVGGISFHPHPDGRMIVCLNYSLSNAIGVPLGSPKLESRHTPHFSAHRVIWKH